MRRQEFTRFFVIFRTNFLVAYSVLRAMIAHRVFPQAQDTVRKPSSKLTDLTIAAISRNKGIYIIPFSIIPPKDEPQRPL